jgi:outer membrane protein OmpA-like peptidoglycan-associated protein
MHVFIKQKKSIILYCLIFFVLPFTGSRGCVWAEVYPKPILHMCPFIASSLLLHQRDDDAPVEVGNGLLLGVGLSNLFIDNLYTQLTADMEISNPMIEGMYFNIFYQFLFSAGYQFRIKDAISLTPAIGSGLLLQHSNQSILYSPVVNISLMTNLNLIKNHHLYFSFDTSLLVYRPDTPVFRFQLGLLNHYPFIPDVPEKARASIGIPPGLFSPDNDNHNDLAEISLHVKAQGKITYWELTIIDPEENAFFSSSGTGTVPEKIVWDGYSNQGRLVAPETEYSVVLILRDDLNRKTEAEATLSTGVLDSPVLPDQATAAIRVSPELFSPDDDNCQDTVDIFLEVTGNSTIREWTLSILDPRYHPFYSTRGRGPVPEKITWDGQSDTGELVESAVNYYVVLDIIDTYDRRTDAEAVIKTDILVIKQQNELNMRIPDITFGPYSSSLFVDDNVEKTMKNLDILNRLVELFTTEYSEYSIRIEGHANHLDWEDPEKKRIEQETVLIPLSLKRARTVKDSLVILGIDEDRITVFGFGGKYPIVPFDDADNRWKNRRVEFILYKEDE